MATFDIFKLDNYGAVKGDPNAPRVMYFDELCSTIDAYVEGDSSLLMIDACEGQHLAHNTRRLTEERLREQLSESVLDEAHENITKALAFENFIDVAARACATHQAKNKHILISLYKIHTPMATFGEERNMIYSRDDLLNNAGFSFSSNKRFSPAEQRQSLNSVQAIVSVIGDLHMSLLDDENIAAPWDEVDPDTKFALSFCSGYWTTKFYGNIYLQYMRLIGAPFSYRNGGFSIGSLHFDIDTTTIYGHLVSKVLESTCCREQMSPELELQNLCSHQTIVSSFLSKGDTEEHGQLVAAGAICLSVKAALHHELRTLNISQYMSKALLECSAISFSMEGDLVDVRPVIQAIQDGEPDVVVVRNTRILLDGDLNEDAFLTFPHQADDDRTPFLTERITVGPPGKRIGLAGITKHHIYLEPQGTNSFPATIFEGEEKRKVIFKRLGRQLKCTEKGLAERTGYFIYNVVRQFHVMSNQVGSDKADAYSVDKASYWANKLLRDGDDVYAAVKLLSMILEGSIDQRKLHPRSNCCFSELVQQAEVGLVLNSMISHEIVSRMVFLTDRESVWMKVWGLDDYYEVERISESVIRCTRSGRVDNSNMFRCSILSRVSLG